MPGDGVCGGAEIPLGDEVRVDVVVGQRAVLVGAGDAVDAETTLRVVVAERAPEPCRLDEELEPDLALERPRRPVARLVPDRRRPRRRRRCGTPPCPPASSRSTRGRESCATGTPRRRARAVRARSRARSSVEWRQRSASAAARGAVYVSTGSTNRLGVPERVPVVPGAGQPLRRDRPPLGPRAGLERVEEREAHRLLQLGVAFELDVGAVPELVEVRPLCGDEPVPAGVPRLGERGDDLVAQRRHASAGSTSA